MPARLICESGELAGSEFIIEKEATIGRRPDNDITLPSSIVSSHHARIYFDDDAGCYFLEDLNSFNGTRVDGLRIGPAVRLHNEESIIFANEHVFLFELDLKEQSPQEVLMDPFGPTKLALDPFPSTEARTPRQPSDSSAPDEPTQEYRFSSSAWLTKERIQSIVDCDNLVVRNLQVTQSYYRISEGMRRLISGRNVSWCTFATHASKTAGQALRHELMPGLLKSAMIRLAGYENTYFFFDEVLGHGNQPHLDPKKGRLAEAMKQVSLLVSEGNIMVFAELALPFVSFIDAFSRDRSYDKEKLRAFIEGHLRPGPLAQDGQDYLIEAFTAFYNACFEHNMKRKAEYVLQGNLLVGLHEQTRLQPQIDQALAVPLNVFRNRGQLDEGYREQGQTPKRLRQIVTRTTTQMLMSITLPSRELKLNQDVIAPTGVDSFPSELLKIENPRCRTLVRQFESHSDTLTGSAAGNWVSLQQRMRFVVDFFRSHQQYERLWEQPFLPRQVPVIEAGHLPAGPL